MMVESLPPVPLDDYEAELLLDTLLPGDEPLEDRLTAVAEGRGDIDSLTAAKALMVMARWMMSTDPDGVREFLLETRDMILARLGLTLEEYRRLQAVGGSLQVN